MTVIRIESCWVFYFSERSIWEGDYVFAFSKNITYGNLQQTINFDNSEFEVDIQTCFLSSVGKKF